MNCLLIWAVGLNCKMEFIFYGLFLMKHFKFVFTHQSQVSPAEILNKLASSSIQENWISISPPPKQSSREVFECQKITLYVFVSWLNHEIL